jgi:hypothetical protein
VDYGETATSITETQALRLIANRELTYSYLAYTCMTSFGVPIDEHLQLDLYINGRTLYYAGSDGSSIIKLGTLQPVTLRKENFDDYFSLENTFGKGPFAKELRNNHSFAWKIIPTEQRQDTLDEPMYLLVQRDGSVYLAEGGIVDGKNLIASVFGFEVGKEVVLRGLNQYCSVWNFSLQYQIRLEEFPDITFQAPGSIAMIDASGKIHSMIGNPRTVYFADLNQDGYREFVAEGGDGDDDDPFYINIYDIKNKAGYVLRDFGKQYSLMVNSSMVVDVFDHINKTFIGGPKTLTLSTSDDGYILELYDNSQIWYQEEATYRD